jgi:hypothetical protein
LAARSAQPCPNLQPVTIASKKTDGGNDKTQNDTTCSGVRRHRNFRPDKYHRGHKRVYRQPSYSIKLFFPYSHLVGTLLAFSQELVRGDGLVLPIAEQVEVFATLATPPQRLALLRAFRRVPGVDIDSLGLGAEGEGLQIMHCKRVAPLSYTSLALSKKCYLSIDVEVVARDGIRFSLSQ